MTKFPVIFTNGTCLNDDERDTFDSLTVPVLEYKGLNDKEEHDIFIDFNKTTKLSWDDYINAIDTDCMKNTLKVMYEKYKGRANQLIEGQTFTDKKKFLSTISGLFVFVYSKYRLNAEVNKTLVEYLQDFEIESDDDVAFCDAFDQSIGDCLNIIEGIIRSDVKFNTKCKRKTKLKKHMFMDICYAKWIGHDNDHIGDKFVQLNDDLEEEYAQEYYARTKNNGCNAANIRLRYNNLF